MFADNYDESLLLILNYDSKNREVLLSFLSSLPFKVHKEIVKMVEQYNQNNKLNLCQEIIMNGVVYYFWIDLADGSLNISSYLKKDRSKNDIFIIKLCPYNKNNIANCSLGSFIYQKKICNQSFNCDKVQYTLKKMFYGMTVQMTREYALFSCSYKKISDNSMYDFEDYGLKTTDILCRRRRKIGI